MRYVMQCMINEEEFFFEEDQVEKTDGLIILNLGYQRYYVFSDSDSAGEAAVDYWKVFTEWCMDDFIRMFGEAPLKAWERGESAGKDMFEATSLEEWIEAKREVPEETFAKYDSEDRNISFGYIHRKKKRADVTEDLLIRLFGFVPKVAYRYE